MSSDDGVLNDDLLDDDTVAQTMRATSPRSPDDEDLAQVVTTWRTLVRGRVEGLAELVEESRLHSVELARQLEVVVVERDLARAEAAVAQDQILTLRAELARASTESRRSAARRIVSRGRSAAARVLGRRPR